MNHLTPDELCQLVDSHFSTLVLYARGWNPEEAEDLVQDAFLQLVKRSHWEGRPEQPIAWLFRVVRNRAIDRFRRDRKRVEREESFAKDRLSRFETGRNATFYGEEIASELDAMPPEQREIVLARIWGGLTFDEIAELLASSRTTVYRLYTEALATMKQRFSHD